MKKSKGIRDYDNSWLGNMNVSGEAKLYDRQGKLIVRCLDTPNVVQAAIDEHKPFLVIDSFGKVI